jgi:hypothetical protein
MLHKFFIRRPVRGHGVMPYVVRAYHTGPIRPLPWLRLATYGAAFIWAFVFWATGDYAPW